LSLIEGKGVDKVTLIGDQPKLKEESEMIKKILFRKPERTWFI